MKLRFQAIDQNGRVVRGVLRADSEAEAREMLLAEEAFPKKFDEVPEDEQVTWVSKTWVKEKHARTQARGEENVTLPAGVSTATAALNDGTGVYKGRFAISGSVLYFETSGLVRQWPAEKIEDARVTGFPDRWLMVSLLDGSLLEFRAGFIFTPPVFKEALAMIKGRGG